MEIIEVVANNLKALRYHHDHSQSRFAQLTGIDKGRISKYENMKIEMRISTMFNIGHAYKINPMYLFVESTGHFDIWLSLAKDSYNKCDTILDVLDYLENY